MWCWCGDDVEKFVIIAKKHELFSSVILFASFCQIQNILSPLQPTESNTGKNELPVVPKERLLYSAAHHSTFLWWGVQGGAAGSAPTLGSESSSAFLSLLGMAPT